MMSAPDDSLTPVPSDGDESTLGDRIVVPAVPDDRSDIPTLALDLAAETRARLVFADLATPEGGAGSSGRAPGEAAEGARPTPAFDDVSTATVTGSGRSRAEALEGAISRRSTDTIVLENRPRVDLTDLFLGETTARLASRTRSNVFVVTEADRRESVSSILVPVGGGPYSGLALTAASVLADVHDAWIDVYHVVDPAASSASRRRAEEYVESCVEYLGNFDRVDTWIHESADVSDAIIEQTKYYDVTLLGSPTKGRLRRFLFGSTTDDVRTEARNTVVTVRGP